MFNITGAGLGSNVYVGAFYNAQMGTGLDIGVSSDGIHFSQLSDPTNTYNGGGTDSWVRDPSIVYWGGQWVVAYTNSTSATTTFSIATSPDLINWTYVDHINMAPYDTQSGYTFQELLRHPDDRYCRRVALLHRYDVRRAEQYALPHADTSPGNVAHTAWSTPTNVIPAGKILNDYDVCAWEIGPTYYVAFTANGDNGGGGLGVDIYSSSSPSSTGFTFLRNIQLDQGPNGEYTADAWHWYVSVVSGFEGPDILQLPEWQLATGNRPCAYSTQLRAETEWHPLYRFHRPV